MKLNQKIGALLGRLQQLMHGIQVLYLYGIFWSINLRFIYRACKFKFIACNYGCHHKLVVHGSTQYLLLYCHNIDTRTHIYTHERTSQSLKNKMLTEQIMAQMTAWGLRDSLGWCWSGQDREWHVVVAPSF